MRIAFDAQLLMKGEKTGVGWSAENILLNMTKDKSHEYQLNCFSLGYHSQQYKNVEKYSREGYYIKRCRWFHDVLYRMMWSFIPIPYNVFFGKKADITMFFNYVIPPGVAGKKITIVHDMAYKAYPETVRKKTRNMLNIALKKSLKRADKIITVSEFSKQEIMKYLNIEKDKIVVMPNGIDFSIYHSNYKKEEIIKTTNKYNIDGPYLLYVGTLEPRKNIERLIEAYGLLKDKIADIPKLVIAGRKGWMYESIFETVKLLHLENSIVFTGYIDAEDTPILMKGAELFLFPSLYEGFGMPPIEAMACGTPVIVSNTASLPEVVGDAGILVDPFSVESIRDGMELLLKNESIRTELSFKGMERAKLYTWDRSVRILQRVFDELK